MKFAICNETFLDWPLEKAIEVAKDAGYTGLEIAPFTLAADAYQISQMQRVHVRQTIEDAGMEVVGLHWLLAKTTGFYLTTPDAAVRKKTSNYLCELARCCRDLGGTLMVLGSPQQRNLLPNVTHEQGMLYAAEVLKGAVPTFEKCNVTLAIEPLGPVEGDFLNTAASGLQLMEMVNSVFCRLHLDCKAMSTEARPVADIIRDFAPHMAHFHANDPNKLGPGMGELDFVPIMKALLDVNYQDWVSVEVFDYTPGPEVLARDSLNNLYAALEQAKTLA